MREFRIECRHSSYKTLYHLILFSVKRAWWRREKWEYLSDEKGSVKIFSTFSEAQEEIKKQRKEEKVWWEDVYIFSEKGDYLDHYKEESKVWP